MIPIRLWTHEIEEEAQRQLQNIASLPWVFHHVAAMPDVHWGLGATVGSVIAMKNAVAPAAVGVDIGCGMGAVKLSLRAENLPENLKKIRQEFERSIPVGYEGHISPAFEKSGFLKLECNALLSEQKNLAKNSQSLSEKASLQLGTLGGGNHFIELCLDTKGNVWILLHSGSRHIGKVLAEHHITQAKKLAHNAELPDPDLAVFLSHTPEMKAYRHDLKWAQAYAMLNRKLMMSLLVQSLEKFYPREKLKPLNEIWCHHNYVAEEYHFGEKVLLTRKGAISAKLGEMGIIPGSMGTKSFIVEGLGNPDSFCSASHGAGRKMSRNKAKKNFKISDLLHQTQGVECRKDIGVLDEIPGAYKNIHQVMENQKDLVKIVTELKQVLCVKG